MTDQTFHEALLTQAEPLEKHEIDALKGWMIVLEEDCELFGETPEDTGRIASIKARLEKEAAR